MKQNELEKSVESKTGESGINLNEYDLNQIDSAALRSAMEYPATPCTAGAWEKIWKEKKSPCRLIWP